MGRYYAIGGDVFDGVGHVVPFATIPAIVESWGRCAITADHSGGRRIARLYARTALDLHSAYERARMWRRASGCLPSVGAAA